MYNFKYYAVLNRVFLACTIFALLFSTGWNENSAFASSTPSQTDNSTVEANARGPWPATPPAKICNNPEFLDGPSTPPDRAIVVPAGNNENLDFSQTGKTYWFESGIHTLGPDANDQIIPGDNSTFVGAPGAVIDGQHKNLLAFTQRAENVTIKYLTIRNFGTGASNFNEGVVNHNSGENWTITHNTIINNDGAGIMMGSGNVVSYNCIQDNGQYGFQSFDWNGIESVVVKDIALDHNEVAGNNADRWDKVYNGCGCTGGGKFWETQGAKVTNNWVHDNKGGPGLWADTDNVGFVFEDNYIADNDGEGLFYEVSYNFMIKNNTFIRNALVKGKEFADRGDRFPVGAIYISESGGDKRAGNQYAESQIMSNYFLNNWDGIVLWENANRFCRPNEPFDTTNGCPFIDNTPGARYKTQNIIIHNNVFDVNRETIGCTSTNCARMGLFSSTGTYPDYEGSVIKEAITFNQNNRWRNNIYIGPWRFAAYEVGREIGFDEWISSPYNQDNNSKIEDTVY